MIFSNIYTQRQQKTHISSTHNQITHRIFTNRKKKENTIKIYETIIMDYYALLMYLEMMLGVCVVISYNIMTQFVFPHPTTLEIPRVPGHFMCHYFDTSHIHIFGVRLSIAILCADGEKTTRPDRYYTKYPNRCFG